MADFRSSFDDDDLMNARMNRERRMNPPQSEPGMGDEDAWASGFDNDLGVKDSSFDEKTNQIFIDEPKSNSLEENILNTLKTQKTS